MADSVGFSDTLAISIFPSEISSAVLRIPTTQKSFFLAGRLLLVPPILGNGRSLSSLCLLRAVATVKTCFRQVLVDGWDSRSFSNRFVSGEQILESQTRSAMGH